MSSWIAAHEAPFRGVAFVVMFAAMAMAEVFLEARPLRVGRRSRWMQNLALTLINTAILRAALPLAAVLAATWSARSGFGLLHHVEWHGGVEILVALVVLDLTIYGQHVLFHAVPALFRFHQVHHTDLDIDVTSGTRFHPVEMLLSALLKFAAVAALGATPVATILFETLLAVTSLFTHANVRLPRKLDAVLRWLIVTPSMHAIHHSALRADRDTNYGFNLPLWDRLFRTYRADASGSHPPLGLEEHQDGARQTLRWLLTLPFMAPRPATHTVSSRLNSQPATTTAA